MGINDGKVTIKKTKIGIVAMSMAVTLIAPQILSEEVFAEEVTTVSDEQMGEVVQENTVPTPANEVAAPVVEVVEEPQIEQATQQAQAEAQAQQEAEQQAQAAAEAEEAAIRQATEDRAKQEIAKLPDFEGKQSLINNITGKSVEDIAAAYNIALEKAQLAKQNKQALEEKNVAEERSVPEAKSETTNAQSDDKQKDLPISPDIFKVTKQGNIYRVQRRDGGVVKLEGEKEFQDYVESFKKMGYSLPKVETADMVEEIENKKSSIVFDNVRNHYHPNDITKIKLISDKLDQASKIVWKIKLKNESDYKEIKGQNAQTLRQQLTNADHEAIIRVELLDEEGNIIDYNNQKIDVIDHGLPHTHSTEFPTRFMPYKTSYHDQDTTLLEIHSAEQVDADEIRWSIKRKGSAEFEVITGQTTSELKYTVSTSDDGAVIKVDLLESNGRLLDSKETTIHVSPKDNQTSDNHHNPNLKKHPTVTRITKKGNIYQVYFGSYPIEYTEEQFKDYKKQQEAQNYYLPKVEILDEVQADSEDEKPLLPGVVMIVKKGNMYHVYMDNGLEGRDLIIKFTEKEFEEYKKENAKYEFPEIKIEKEDDEADHHHHHSGEAEFPIHFHGKYNFTEGDTTDLFAHSSKEKTAKKVVWKIKRENSSEFEVIEGQNDFTLRYVVKKEDSHAIIKIEILDAEDKVIEECEQKIRVKAKSTGETPTTEPATGDEATEPTTGDEATEPTTGDEATTPEQGDEATEPEQGGEATEPTTGDEATEPEQGDEATEPTTGDETTTPEQGDETTEPEEDSETTDLDQDAVEAIAPILTDGVIEPAPVEETLPKNEWIKVNDKWTYYNEQGTKTVGWIKEDNNWYFFNFNGDMQVGWIRDGAHWYHLNENGQMARGWEKINGTYYLFTESGRMIKNQWTQYDGKWYFLKANGEMAINETIDGWKVDETGAWIN